MTKYTLILFVILFAIKAGFSQINVLAFRSSYGISFPLSDLKERYGSNLEVSLGAEYQKARGAQFAIYWAYLFGNKVNFDALASFRQPNGSLIGADGQLSDVYFRNRGQMIGADVLYKFGKRKSGLIAGIGAGIVSYYSSIVDDSRTFVQKTGVYKQLFDLKTIGPFVKPQIGWHIQSSSGLFNGKIILDGTLAFTKFQHASPYNPFNNTSSRLKDHALGIKFIWLLPIRKSGEDDTIKYF